MLQNRILDLMFLFCVITLYIVINLVFLYIFFLFYSFFTLFSVRLYHPFAYICTCILYDCPLSFYSCFRFFLFFIIFYLSFSWVPHLFLLFEDWFDSCHSFFFFTFWRLIWLLCSTFSIVYILNFSTFPTTDVILKDFIFF